MKGFFRPHNNPARLLYDTFQKAAERRNEIPLEEWEEYELTEVWKAARDYAQTYNLSVPTIEQVKAANRRAEGHCDYGAKLAYGVAECMKQSPCNSFGADPDSKPGPLTQEDRGWKPGDDKR